MKPEELRIFQKLRSRAFKKSIAFHMPGHKRNTSFAPYLSHLGAQYDITEIPGFDNLQSPQDLILQTMEQAKLLWKSKHSFLLVNGSTGGILAAIYTMVSAKDKILVARNCHKSVYNAIELLDLQPVFLSPPINQELDICGSIDPETVKQALECNKDIQLVILTSPTYDGVLTDVASICNVAHKNNIPVLVDEAHGAHLGMHENFEKGAIFSNADIVIQSLHKTLPSLTQTAIAHICSDRIDPVAFQNSLSVFQTSSPSYLLLSSIDECVNLLLKEKHILFEKWLKNLDYLDEQLATLENIKPAYHGKSKNMVYKGIYSYDRAKLILSVKGTNISGQQLYERLKKQYNIVCEMYFDSYVLVMLSMCDNKHSIKSLCKALLCIDGEIKKQNSIEDFHQDISFKIPTTVLSIVETRKKKYEVVPLNNACGLISAEFIWAYPPGIPYIIPGEIITEKLIKQFTYLNKKGINLKSDYNHELGYICVIFDKI